MIQYSAPRPLTLALAISLLASVGCATDRRADDPTRAPEAATPVPVVVAPVPADPPPSSVQACTSTRDATGLVCSSCEGDDPGAALSACPPSAP